MTVISYKRGYEIEWDGKQWIYSDTKEPIKYIPYDDRPCARCGRMPTPEGHDACLGHIDGVKSACCGHGVTKPFILYEDEPLINMVKREFPDCEIREGEE